MARSKTFQFKELHAALVLIIFHFVGIIGLSGPWRSFFITLTSFNLLLSLFILLWFTPKFTGRFIVFSILSFVIGYGAEWIGVHTGYLFGDYSYGKALGLKLDEIPLMIGINWLMLTIGCGELAHKISKNIWVKMVIGAIFMTALDYLIEPVAIDLGFWHWNSIDIPLSNYLGWFFVSIPLQYLFQWSRNGNNPAAKWLILSQLLFFIALRVL
jgi:putative membrane protein